MAETAKPNLKMLRDAILKGAWGESTLAHPRPQIRVKKTGKPVTADCHAVHMPSWCGGVTPKKPAAE